MLKNSILIGAALGVVGCYSTRQAPSYLEQCKSDDDCLPEEYCRAAHCTLRCVTDEDCGDGHACNEVGRCNPADPGECIDGVVDEWGECVVEEDDDDDEVCDDCEPSLCGNGVIDDGEQCDDGTDNSTSGACLPNCMHNICGDDFLHIGVEECDNGEANSPTATCTPECKVNVCGDGYPGPGEACDPGKRCEDNTTDCTTDSTACADIGGGDCGPQYAVGCDTDCTAIEFGFCCIHRTNCVPAGTKNETNRCEECVPIDSTSRITWTTLPDATSCSDGSFCDGERTCQSGVCQPPDPPCPDPAFPYCSNEQSACFQCLEHAHCPDGFCNPQGQCVECLNAGHCDDGVFCNGAEICSGGACGAGADPCDSQHPICDESMQACIQCYDENDCGEGTMFPNQPICTTNNRCVSCLGNSDCPEFNLGFCCRNMCCGCCLPGDHCGQLIMGQCQ